MSYSDDSVVQKRARVSGTIVDDRVLIVAYDSYKQMYLCTAPSRTTFLVQATAPVSACLQPTQCLAARTGRGEVSKAGKHTSSKRLYDEYETRYKKMLYFVETTHEVAETVIFRKNIPVSR